MRDKSRLYVARAFVMIGLAALVSSLPRQTEGSDISPQCYAARRDAASPVAGLSQRDSVIVFDDFENQPELRPEYWVRHGRGDFAIEHGLVYELPETAV